MGLIIICWWLIIDVYNIMVRIIENYTLFEIIGEGAYGKVYRAINKNDNKEYAVKVIEKLEECTVNQINILTNIEKHQHIIKYIDMLKTPNNFYFVYQFCNGGTLEGMLRKQKSIPQKKALLIFKQLIDAFQVLNKYNIMHRDLKPDNIFFNQGVVKLGDFGFCKSLEKANMTKTMLGSPIYMAPQILRGQIYSTKADIWSLGVVLYEMLYGFCPFQSTTIPKLIEVLKQTQLQFPNSQPISEDTKRLLCRLLTKDPTKRIQWMELLRTNITMDGKLVDNKQQRLLLVEEDNNSAQKTIKKQDNKKQESLNSSTYSSTASTLNSYQSDQSIGVNAPNSVNNFSKKKPFLQQKNNIFAANIQRRNTANLQKQQSQNDLKKSIVRQHAECTRGLHISADLIKANDPNAALFAYLILKRVQQKMVKIRDQIANAQQFRDIVGVLNSQLKQIYSEYSKLNINQNTSNWKGLVKGTGDFHRNYRAFYMMVAFLSGECPREDLSHLQMQQQVRAKLY